MNQINPYLRTRENVMAKIGQENPNLFAGKGFNSRAANYGLGPSLALQGAMQKAKAYEQDAGAAATGDVMAQVRNAGKGESIKRDIDEDQAIQEFKLYTIESQLRMLTKWTA